MKRKNGKRILSLLLTALLLLGLCGEALALEAPPPSEEPVLEGEEAPAALGQESGDPGEALEKQPVPSPDSSVEPVVGVTDAHKIVSEPLSDKLLSDKPLSDEPLSDEPLSDEPRRDSPYGTPVEGSSGTGNGTGNVVWQEYTNGSEDILVFSVVDPARPAEECAITTPFNTNTELRGRVTKIVLEEGITGVGWADVTGQINTFQDFSALTSVVACASMRRIGRSAFRRCTALSSFTIPAGSRLESVGRQAFSPCGPLSLDLSGCSALSEIGYSAFYQDSYNADFTVKLPEGGGAISSIGKTAFGNTGITELDLSEAEVTVIPEGSFQRCAALRSVDLPDTLSTIEIRAFQNCTALESVTIPASVTSVANSAFSGCRGIKDLTWNAASISGNSLNGNEFSSASGFKLTVGASVDRLPKYFFKATKNAGQIFFEGVSGGHRIEITTANVTADGTVPMITAITHDCYVDEHGVVYELTAEPGGGNGTARVAYCSPYGDLTDYTIPATVTTGGKTYDVTAVADGAFTKAPALEMIRFAAAAQIESVGAEAFKGVASLTKVVTENGEADTIRGATALFGAGVVGTDAFRDTGLGYDIIRIEYRVAEPGYLYGSTPSGSLPEVVGGSTVTDPELTSFDTHALRGVTPQIMQSIRTEGHYMIYSYLFRGWETETGAILAPGEEPVLGDIDADADGVVVLKSVWSSKWKPGESSGTPSVRFSLWVNIGSANEAISANQALSEASTHYSRPFFGSIMCAVADDGSLIYPEELASPARGGSGMPNVGRIYTTWLPDEPANGKYMLISFHGDGAAADRVKAADSAIRSLTTGYTGDDSDTYVPGEPDNHAVTWKLFSFPQDADVLAALRAQIEAPGSTVIARDENGDPIPSSELTEENFCVRWIQVKYQSTSTDGWNINGILKRKFDYKIRFDPNDDDDASGTMADLDARYDESVTLTDNAYTRTRWLFNGWNTEPDGSGRAFADGQTITENLVEEPSPGGETVVTLYAQWRAKPELTITAASRTWPYDGTTHADTTVTVTSGTLTSGDELIASATGAVTNVGDTSDGNNPVGDGYKIMRGTQDVTDLYVIIPVAGTLTITPAELTITAKPQTHVYNAQPQGEDDASYTAAADIAGKVTVEGLQGSDALTRIKLNGLETNVGGYDGKLVPSGAEVGAATGNYTFTYVAGKLTITPAELTITAKPQTYTYSGSAQGESGTAYEDPAVIAGKVTAEGLQGSDALTSVTLDGSETNAGTYDGKLVPSEASLGAATGNYTISYTAGTLTIRKKVITITAASRTWPYDGTAHADPGVTVSSGALLADDELVASATGSVTNVADTAEGNNPVAAGWKILHGGADVTANYEITAVAGTLTITPLAITITAASDEWVYDGAEHRNTAVTVTSGAVAPDERLEAGAEGSVTTVADNAAFNNPIAAGYKILRDETDVTANYTVTPVAGTLTITQRAITVTSAGAERSYTGTPLTADGGEVTEGDLAEGDRLEVTNTGTITDVGETPNTVGEIRILRDRRGFRAAVDMTANYTITPAEGTLKVTPAVLTIKTESAKKTYDGKPLTKTNVFTLDGLQNGETVTFKVTGSQTEVGSSKNTYVLTWDGTAKESNYAVKETLGTLEVLTVPVTGDGSRPALWAALCLLSLAGLAALLPRRRRGGAARR